jgi:hypothetical protein
MYIVKDAEMTFVQKMRAYIVDEIDVLATFAVTDCQIERGVRSETGRVKERKRERDK